MTKIRIGHSAYSGANALAICNSKAAAVRELRMRGVLRDKAREAVKDVCARVAGYVCIYDQSGLNVIEISNDISPLTNS